MSEEERIVSSYMPTKNYTEVRELWECKHTKNLRKNHTHEYHCGNTAWFGCSVGNGDMTINA